MTSSFTDQYTGLWSTPELVGRQDILEKFERILNDPSTTTRLVFLHGVGGIGKTRLLRKALEIAQGLKTCRVAEDVMDFYHIGLHTPIGLTNAIFEILTPPFDCFQAYQSAYQAFANARPSGNGVELEKLRNDAMNTFDQDLKQLSASKRVVLVLDTAERIVYGLTDWSDEIPLAHAWEWLIEKLPTWQNVTIFVAGREETRPAIERMKMKKSVTVEEMEIGSFSLNDSLQYFDAVVKLLEEKKEYQLAERLKNLPLDFKKGAHAYSDGRPILLSLLVDYLSFPGEGKIEEMLRELGEDLDEEDYQQYEEALIKRLQEHEKGQTLIALGRIPKGGDEELLSAILNVTVPEARKRLNDVLNLSVVKKRPEDNYIFLHDEMYAMLQRRIYDSHYDANNQKTSFEAIKEYYKNRREKISHYLNELYAPVEEQGKERLDVKKLGEAHTQYQTLLTEIMYYYLRNDLGRGFRAYYRFSHEAIMARDMLMDLQLQAELLSYLSRPPAPILETDITIKMILESLKTRPPARDWALGKYGTGITEAHTTLDKVNKDWQENSPVLLAALHAWASSLHILRGEKGDYDEAEIHLQKVYALLPEKEVNLTFTDPLYPNTLLWHKKATAALAHRVHGYLKRVQGFMPKAVEEYQKAAVLLREIDLRIEMATTMNDMGFAQAELGAWHDARSNVSDALRLRRELGSRVPVALSLNTLAAIQVREGQYADARENSERSLTIFNAFSHKRDIGMALTTLAEAVRRYAGATPPLIPMGERMDLLRRARDLAREAYNNLKDEEKEKSRQVETLIEIGSACRDWAWMLMISPHPGDNRERLRRESQDALQDAANLAKEANLTYRHVDALVNMAWLEFYMLDEEKQISEDHAVWKSIKVAESTFPPETEIGKQPQVWSQKGKLYTLKGHLAVHRFVQIRKRLPKGMTKEIEEVLAEMGMNYARSLDYSSRFAPDYQGIRQGKDGISERLKRLNAAEMRVVCNRIHELYPQGSIIETFLTNRALWQTS
jgi:hypothetical protein